MGTIVCRLRARWAMRLALGVGVLVPGAAWGGDAAPPAAGPKAQKPKAPPLRIEKPEHPFRMPDGPSHEAWTRLLKNDVAAAEPAFRAVLEKHPDDLAALEGLRACLIFNGRYAETQQVNIRQVLASAGSALCHAFALRAMEARSFTESRAALLDAFGKAAAKALPATRATLRDLQATLYLAADRAAAAKAELKGLGYVERWLFAAGPFGFHDRNNRMERRFEPERSLKSLAFHDERGQAVSVRKDLPVPLRSLRLDRLFPGARGIFYAFTNLQSDRDREILIVAGAPSTARFYLRGLPVIVPLPDKQFPRRPRIVRTRLLKGANPLLVKMPFAGRLAVRILGPDHAPLPGVSVQPLAKEAWARHEVVPVRGYLFSEEADGALAEHFLKRFKADERALGKGLATLARDGSLNVAQARWLELAARQENDLAAREAVARTLIGSFPDSLTALDVGATVLADAGRRAGRTPSRYAEEARQLRERALAIRPDSHQHLLGLYYFFSERNLNEQAFKKIKACARAHPDSAVAQAQLGEAYLRKNLDVLAQRQFERAAKLEPAYRPRLARFLAGHGSRVRARALQDELAKRGRVSRRRQFRQRLERGQLSEAGVILAELEKAYPGREAEWLDLRADLLLEKSDLEEAYKIRKELAARQPKNRGARLALVDLALRLGKDQRAKALLRAYLKEHPGDYEQRRRLRDLEDRPPRRWWKPYDIDVKSVDTAKFNQENYPRANHAWIVDFMVTKIYPDLSTESYIHIAQKVLNVEGINELSEVLVQAQREDIVFIRTLNPDGSSFQPENVHEFNLSRSASLYKVGPGSILEHAYLQHADADEVEPRLKMGFNFNALDAPRALSRWVVMLPKGRHLKIRKIRPEAIDEKILPGPPGFTVYQWTNKHVEGIKVEPFMPGEQDEEVVPLVFIESPERTYRATGWLQRRERYFPPPAAAAQAKKIAAHFPEAAMKFRAIVEWVRLNIQPGKEARTLDDVWALRSGNSSQMTDLAVAMCRAAGLDVHSALLNGAYRPGRVWRSKNAERPWEPSQFSAFGGAGRMMLLEPDAGSETWLQFGGQPAKYFSVTQWMDPQAGALALVLGDAGVRVKRVLGKRLGKVPFSQQATVSLGDEGRATVHGVFRLFGLTAGALRRALADPRQAKKVRESVGRNLWPRIELDSVNVTGQADVEQPLRFVYFGSVPDLATPAGPARFLAPFPRPARLLALMGPPGRTHDLVLRQELAELDVAFRYEAPPGHCWVQVPNDLFLCTEFGFYLADFNVKGRRLTCNRSYLLPMQRVEPKKYAKLMRFLRTIAESERQRVGYARRDFSGFGGLARPLLSLGYASAGAPKKKKAKAEGGAARAANAPEE